ncbi:hypothetical protein JAAARDRAFT_63764 [Jaapia argillacea MUCL 33604]|uniref:Uncharacterized protein n=1 Tax=Jaapia argillacea MUCL 33604 TaxID=933084 RepID=A0A067P3F8_9AGAM|nr:hypothetical protein JAAARDRAFT_63764 [Jaapia argillacea MUCL 33604]
MRDCRPCRLTSCSTIPEHEWRSCNRIDLLYTVPRKTPVRSPPRFLSVSSSRQSEPCLLVHVFSEFVVTGKSENSSDPERHVVDTPSQQASELEGHLSNSGFTDGRRRVPHRSVIVIDARALTLVISSPWEMTSHKHIVGVIELFVSPCAQVRTPSSELGTIPSHSTSISLLSWNPSHILIPFRLRFTSQRRCKSFILHTSLNSRKDVIPSLHAQLTTQDVRLRIWSPQQPTTGIQDYDPH